jgi:hypothetical protein
VSACAGVHLEGSAAQWFQSAPVTTTLSGIQTGTQPHSQGLLAQNATLLLCPLFECSSSVRTLVDVCVCVCVALSPSLAGFRCKYSGKWLCRTANLINFLGGTCCDLIKRTVPCCFVRAHMSSINSVVSRV